MLTTSVPVDYRTGGWVCRAVRRVSTRRCVAAATWTSFWAAFGRVRRRDAWRPTGSPFAAAWDPRVPSRGATAIAPLRSRVAARPPATSSSRATSAVSRLHPVPFWTMPRAPRDSLPARASQRSIAPESPLSSERAAPSAPKLCAHLLEQQL